MKHAVCTEKSAVRRETSTEEKEERGSRKGKLETDLVAILDFGSQYSQLIARRIRESKVYCEILRHDTTAAELRKREPKAIILSGGPASVSSREAPVCDRAIFDLGIPVLGICYGMQLMGRLLRGEIVASKRREYGKAALFTEGTSDIFHGLGGQLAIWMSHGDQLSKAPSGFQVIGRTPNSPVAAIMHEKKKLYGLQFHPEVVHTPRGREILRNFLFRVAGCSPSWTMRSFAAQAVEEIRERVGKERVICAMSGGVDSSVTATLVDRAVGDHLVCVFVDNGLLRKGEADEVAGDFKDRLNLKVVRGQKRFLDVLKGVRDPEEKRRRIGREFVKIFEKEAVKIGRVKFLAQGTLYPDVIESFSPRGGPSATIKTHHNVGGLPKKMKLKLIEPLRELFKDEVRTLGKELGLPDALVQRQPFPGPGLGVRILGDVTRSRLALLREADAVLSEELVKEPFAREIWQSFAVLLPIRTVGVQGDERTYDNVVALRMVTSTDGMTADWARVPHTFLERVSSRITNEIKGINRVVYDTSSKPPSTIEWE